MQSPRNQLFLVRKQALSDSRGYSLIEALIVVAMIGVLTAMAVPQMVAMRRATRAAGLTREIMSQMRKARQLAMSQRQAVTFQYNNVSKTIDIIDHNNNLGRALLSDASYPNTAGSLVVNSTPLATGGLISTEITYGIPPGLPTVALRDGVSMTALFNNRLNITFQPDGSVVDAAGNPDGRALFVYNSTSPRLTAAAISVVGASGRVKIWRYDTGANLYND